MKFLAETHFPIFDWQNFSYFPLSALKPHSKLGCSHYLSCDSSNSTQIDFERKTGLCYLKFKRVIAAFTTRLVKTIMEG